MVSKKVVFIAFAIEDERQRDFLKELVVPTRAVRVHRHVGEGTLPHGMEGARPHAHQALPRRHWR